MGFTCLRRLNRFGRFRGGERPPKPRLVTKGKGHRAAIAHTRHASDEASSLQGEEVHASQTVFSKIAVTMISRSFADGSCVQNFVTFSVSGL